jgi:hypothetical protein
MGPRSHSPTGVEERISEVAAQKPAKNVLLLRIPHLPFHGKCCGETGHLVVKERLTGFEGDRHRHPIDLEQEISRQLARHVEVHEAVTRIEPCTDSYAGLAVRVLAERQAAPRAPAAAAIQKSSRRRRQLLAGSRHAQTSAACH